MKILVINGSPKGQKSNTMWLTNAFISGFPDTAEVKIIHLKDKDIHPCMGCFSCWTKTPGRCAIQDDMQEIYQAILESDVIIESMPLYFAGVPSRIRMMTERCLLFTKRYEGSPEDSFHTILELDEHNLMDKKLVLISSCGYVSMDTMFEGLLKEYDLICGAGNYTKILCAQGELLQAGDRTRQVVNYLEDVREAGREFYENGCLTPERERKLSEPMVSPKTFEILIKRYWSERM
ncbi:MAG: flavodoxin family protein [Lachnospiraceae bacterium]|nr:flavodoxin family protein [Lachnospiraceae bacterium]